MAKNKWWRPMKFKSQEELTSKIEEYFNYCDTHKKPYTITWLAYFLWTTMDLLLDYENNHEQFSDTIKRAKQRVQLFVEEALFWNNVTWVIFNLKNNFWRKDKQEIDQNIKWDLNIVTWIEIINPWEQPK